MGVVHVRVKGKAALPEIIADEAFYDTNNESILMAYTLGIVKGSNGAFLPYAEITRQEAAVMLTRLAAQLGLSGEKSKVLFNDDDDIADWAKESVYTLTTIKDSQTGMSIMNGKSNNMFAPLDPFTTEQTIVTLLRLYNAAVPVED